MWLHLCWLSRALPEPLQATGADELCLKMPPLDIRLRYFVVVWSKAFTWKECSLLKLNQEVSEASTLLSLLLPYVCTCWREFCSSLSWRFECLSTVLFSLWIFLCSSYHFHILETSQAEVSVIDPNLISVTSLWPVIKRKNTKIGRTGQFSACR